MRKSLSILLSVIVALVGLSFSARSTTSELIEVPAPRTDIPEQILYRRGYIVSYNKRQCSPTGWHGILLPIIPTVRTKEKEMVFTKTQMFLIQGRCPMTIRVVAR